MLKVLIVDDSSTVRLSLSKVLRDLGHEPVFAQSGLEALMMYDEERPDLVLLDIEMPGMDGCQTCLQIRERSADRWVPVIFLSSKDSDKTIERAIESGGDDYLVKPVSSVVLNAKIRAMRRIHEMRKQMVALTRELAEANRELRQLSTEDPLTGLGNRRLFDSRLEPELQRSVRASEPFCLLLFDVDHFKLYNDFYGHPAGDECLREIAKVLRSICRRPADLAVRYGGEEFAVLLPETPKSGGLMLAKLFARLLANRALPHAASKTAVNVTASVGLAVFDPGAKVACEDLILKADEALYQAKERGRNQCFCYDADAGSDVMVSMERERGSRPTAIAHRESG
jgi:diguanylate cyclase (GGDEF)-like protein